MPEEGHESGNHYKRDIEKMGVEQKSVDELADKLGLNDELVNKKTWKKLNLDDLVVLKKLIKKHRENYERM